MNTVLIVDDEKPFLLSLADGLTLYYSREFNVLTAENGKKAIELLDTTKVDLVITDLKMPVTDGFDLLAFMSKNHPEIPVIVMTAFGNPEVEERLKNLDFVHYLEKPLDFHELATKIRENLPEDAQGHVHNVILPAFLQLAELEKKSCTLKITSEEKVGYLYFSKGDLVDAETEENRGEQAAFDIVSWDNAAIEITPASRKRKKNINSPLSRILSEVFRLKDERTKIQKERRVESEMVEAEPEEAILLGSLQESQKPFSLRKEVEMAIEKHIEVLREIKGYKAAGIMNFTGEMLAHHSEDSNIDLTLVGATFNDIFRAAHEASKKIGLEACREATISTPKGVIVMRCSGTDAKVHFHVIGILTSDGNQSLMKMQIEKMIPAVMAELA